jgi:Flp pilus assembly pilin Flp
MFKGENQSRKANLRGTHARGQALIEYVLILVLIAIVLMVTVSNMGTAVSNNYSKVDDSMQTLGGNSNSSGK